MGKTFAETGRLFSLTIKDIRGRSRSVGEMINFHFTKNSSILSIWEDVFV